MNWLSKKKIITVYTDGSCLKNPGGAGGWAVVMVEAGKATAFSGHDPCTTNNRMELLACIEALRVLPQGSSVYLYTDSQYVQKGILYWIAKWKRNGWRKGQMPQSKEVKNQDLWEQLDAQNARHLVSWRWIRGHDGDTYNELCDRLAAQAARGYILPLPVQGEPHGVDSKDRSHTTAATASSSS